MELLRLAHDDADDDDVDQVLHPPPSPALPSDDVEASPTQHSKMTSTTTMTTTATMSTTTTMSKTTNFGSSSSALMSHDTPSSSTSLPINSSSIANLETTHGTQRSDTYESMIQLSATETRKTEEVFLEYIADGVSWSPASKLHKKRIHFVAFLPNYDKKKSV